MFIRDVLNLYTFSLQTMEQSFSESHPIIVNKLIEGRKRQCQLLEETLKNKLYDVEQRSKDANFVSKQQLELMEKKAYEKLQQQEFKRKQWIDDSSLHSLPLASNNITAEPMTTTTNPTITTTFSLTSPITLLSHSNLVLKD
jgi:vancomycin resistance protein YoaR